MLPKNTVASIILKWKRFGTTKPLLSTGRPAKLSNRVRRAFIGEVTKNQMSTLSSRVPQSGLYGSGKMEATP
jgi:hypothetical protein